MRSTQRLWNIQYHIVNSSLYIGLDADLRLSSQNGLSGLEYIHPTRGTWTTVAPDHVAVVWGWCSAILSGDRIRATRHRVETTFPGTRRLSAVLFSAPDINTILRPLNGNGAGFCGEIRNGEVG
jgi:isopenicillin N synthase-like dioxygenase